MLIICFVGHRSKYDKLKDLYGKMQSCILTDDWNKFERNLSLLVKELEVFTEIYFALIKLNENIRDKLIAKDKAEKII